jgi:hypothetical protein
MRAAADASDRVSVAVAWVQARPQDRFPIPWHWWQKQLPGTIGEPVLAEMQAEYPEGIGREDLRSRAEGTATGDAPGLLRRFVATMMWGVGTRDGRGPWRVAQGLHTRVTRHHRGDRCRVREGDTAGASRWFTRALGRLDRIAGLFFTKWFWIAGTGHDLVPEPLILDDQVRASLLALQWRADVRGNLKEYLAYLEQVAQWAASLGVAPEMIEEALFEAGGEL